MTGVIILLTILCMLMFIMIVLFIVSNNYRVNNNNNNDNNHVEYVWYHPRYWLRPYRSREIIIKDNNNHNNHNNNQNERISKLQQNQMYMRGVLDSINQNNNSNNNSNSNSNSNVVPSNENDLADNIILGETQLINQTFSNANGQITENTTPITTYRDMTPPAPNDISNQSGNVSNQQVPHQNLTMAINDIMS